MSGRWAGTRQPSSAVRRFWPRQDGDGIRPQSRIVYAMPLRAATTLSEMLIVLVIVGVLLALAVPPSAGLLDRAGVDAATRELGAVFATARAEAIAGRRPVAVLIDTTRGEVRVQSAGVVPRVRFLSALHGVSLSATRDSMSYDARGLGRGAANLTVIIRRGLVHDSLVVSRLGRVRD